MMRFSARAAPALAAWAVLVLAVSSLGAQLAPWPAGAGVEIGHEGQPGGLPAGFETSGAVWHPGRNSVVVVSDEGLVAELPAGGGPAAVWTLPGDLEAIALPDPASSIVWIGLEHPDSVVAFNLATGTATGASWDLTPWMTGPANDGLEALACVDGVAVAGLQVDGTLFRFDLGSGGAVRFLGSAPSHLGRTDLAGLDYDPCSGVLYAIHDTANVLVEYDAAGAFLREYALAGSDQEGVALMVGASAPARSGPLGAETSIWIAQDTGELVRFQGYPVPPCAAGEWIDLGGGTGGASGTTSPPALAGTGSLRAGWPFALELQGALPSAPLLLWLSVVSQPTPFAGGMLHALPVVVQLPLVAEGSGALQLAATWPAGVPPGASVWFQTLTKDVSAPPGFTLSNGLRAIAP